jgi:hypothetical protein
MADLLKHLGRVQAEVTVDERRVVRIHDLVAAAGEPSKPVRRDVLQEPLRIAHGQLQRVGDDVSKRARHGWLRWLTKSVAVL